MSERREGDRYRGLSLWLQTSGDDLFPRPRYGAPPNAGDEPNAPGPYDVAIVGAGFTGLWTAYYLKHADPGLRVAVFEAETAGFGASGRNGGWCSALYPVSLTRLAAEHGRDSAVRQYRAMQASLAEIGRVIESERLDADWARGGTVVAFRNEPQRRRATIEVAEAREYGFGPADLALLDQSAATNLLAAEAVRGAVYTPHCAAIHPGKLVRSLARTVAALGVSIFERSPVSSIEPGRFRTGQDTVRAEIIIRATEGFTPRMVAHRRAVVPVYSLMIATEPLPATVWDQIGLARRETFADFRNLIIYGQRTADNRLTFGGRGAPYHFGSRIAPAFDREPAVFQTLRRTLSDLLPITRDARITHSWGGPLGVARDWHPSVGLDRSTGIGWAGGYVGDGVSSANLAGRTLADLVNRHDTELVSLPWVGHHSRRWEPEPLRWLAVNAGLRAMEWADAGERHGSRPSRVARAVDAALGR
jgi:glycine/D-amino acid oxidase-like deaminating enzyme